MKPGVRHNNLRPIIGIFINNKTLQNRKVAQFAMKLNQANDIARCFLYFFSPENIDWEGHKIDGYVFQGNSRLWLQYRLPFPDIIYDRGAGFSGRENADIETLRGRFKNMPGVEFINSCKLLKWPLYHKLSRYKAVKKYLPVTTLSREMEVIRSMTAKYGYIFLKTSGGSGGKDVYALEKIKDGFYLRYYRKGLHRERFSSHLSALRLDLKPILSPGRDQVIIQQGIRLVKFKNRLMDLRVLMVKDKDGIWNAVYNQARVAPTGAVVTNLSLGGEVMNYSDIYPDLKANYSGVPTDKQIKSICITIAHYIEKEFGPFGEIGMDIGVDETGKVWMLEANSKPSKLPEKKIEDTIGVSPQFLMILEYAKLLYSRKKNARSNNRQ